jgi:hypothetical protein
MNFIRSYKTELALFALSFLIHLILFGFMVEKTGSVLDVVRVDDGYFEITENILAGNGFSWSKSAPYEPNALRTPGYIYILAGLISIAGITGATLIQLFAASLIPVLGMRVAKHISHSRKVGLITGIILALEPTLAFLSFQFYTDTLFILLFLLWVLLTLQYVVNPTLNTLILGAATLGFAALVRPVAQYIPIFVAICILWQFGKSNWRQITLHIGVYFLIIVAILTPWIVRNMETFGIAGLSSQSSFILYTNLAPAILTTANDGNFEHVRDSFLTFEEYKGDAISLANADIYTEKAIDVVREYPEATAFVLGKALLSFFTADGFDVLFARLGHEPGSFIIISILARLFWLAVTLFAIVGALSYIFKERTAWAVMFVILVAYFALTSSLTAFGTNPRYRLPVDPLLLSFASIGLLYGRTWLQKVHQLLKRKGFDRRP